MVARTWLGGGSNNVEDPTDWNPPGIPLAGDELRIFTGTANMTGGDLGGATVLLGNPFDPSTQMFPPAPVLNLAGRASLTELEFDASGLNGAVVNVDGSVTIKSIDYIGFPVSHLTVNIGFHARLRETVHTDGRAVVVFTGIDHSSLLINDGPSFVASAIVDVDVGGKGSWVVAGLPGTRTEFARTVGHGQTITMGGGSDLIIDKPRDFHALVNLDEGWIGASPPFGILLEGVHGDAFTFRNDMLRIKLGHSTQDVLRLHETGGERFTLSDTPTGIVIAGSGGPVAESQAVSGVIPRVGSPVG